jgi:hypothetical protein
MDLTLSEEHPSLRATVEDFARKEVAPVIGELYERGEFPYEIVAKMGAMGLFGLPEHEQRVALLAVGDVILELIEFHPVRRSSYDGRQDDVGYAYPCFEVEDIDAAYQEWTAKGYTIHAKPQITPDGPVEGSKFMILKDPDGKNIEIVETGKYLVASNIHAGEGSASLDAPVFIGKH